MGTIHRIENSLPPSKDELYIVGTSITSRVKYYHRAAKKNRISGLYLQSICSPRLISSPRLSSSVEEFQEEGLTFCPKCEYNLKLDSMGKFVTRDQFNRDKAHVRDQAVKSSLKSDQARRRRGEGEW